ncbi:MAG TPA: DUF6174 domain-containing protein, partial [Verrucomicrobiae bacterium]|nr:DUF6174 domain-containing protein [Verrucomicrobiae bacterium]
LTNYTFKFTRVCMCDHLILNGTVTVKNGQVVAVADVNDRGLPIANPDLSEFKSIEELFEFIRTEQPKAEVTKVSFDEGLYFPARIDVDYITHAADDEISYLVSDVKALP